MEIENRAKEPGKKSEARKRFVRYGSIAAAFFLVSGSILGFALSRGKGAADSAKAVNAPAAQMESASEEASMITAGAAEQMPKANEQALSLDELYERIVNMQNYYGADSTLTMGVTADAAPESTEMDSAVAYDAGIRNEAVAEAPASDENGMGSGAEYSTTNVQVEGVDEADVVKTDGEYIYLLAGQRLIILKANGGETKVVSNVDFLENDEGWWGFSSEMFVEGDRLVILTGAQDLVWVGSGSGRYQDSQPRTLSIVYDISDRTAPKRVAILGQSGNYVSSRLLDGYVYLVTSHSVYSILKDHPETYVPVLSKDGAQNTMSLDSIYLYENADTPTYTVVSSLNIQNGTEQTASRASLGGAGEIYLSRDGRLLIASEEYHNDVTPIAPDQDGKNVQVTNSYSNTRLMLFNLKDGAIERAAAGSVKGTLVNQFAMDYSAGAFRLVTTVSEWTERIYTDGVDTYEYDDHLANALYTLNEALEPLGSIENLAEDETVKSVRFDGDIAYFVTFRQTDPLFCVDLKNPAKPKLLSTLKIPGFSEYLHSFGDGRLLGIGYEADEKTGWQENVKLSMFNTADKTDVKEQSTLPLKASWTTVGQNHKSVLVSVEKNLIAFPADGDYYIYGYSDQDGFVEKASIQVSGEIWAEEIRGLFIGDYFYILSSGGVEVLRMADFASVQTIAFN